MLPLISKNGKLYVEDLEVEAKPIYYGVKVVINLEGGQRSFPPLEMLLSKLFAEKYNEGVNLFEANSYRSFLIDEREIPETSILNGIEKVPEQSQKLFIFDFYKVTPKIRSNPQNTK